MKKEIKTTISIKHQEEKTMHHFEVIDSKNLSKAEVRVICQEMGVSALFIEGRYYKCD